MVLVGKKKTTGECWDLANLVKKAGACVSALVLVWIHYHLGSHQNQGILTFKGLKADSNEISSNTVRHQANPPATKVQKTYDFEPLFKESEEDPWKRQLFSRLDKIRSVCGELCSINDKETFDKKSIPDPDSIFGARLEVDFSCDAIIGASEIDAGDPLVPFPPPDELIPYYSLNGAIGFRAKRRYTNVYLEGKAFENVWKKEDIEEGLDLIRTTGKLPASYHRNVVYTVVDDIGKLNLKGKSVLVVGSERPWVETILLHHGAALVTTLEYGSITSEHPQIRTLTPEQFRKAYREGTLGMFDAVVSYSSLEHSGLGRYGDALNPWGDLLGVARVWCVTKPQGFLFLGLPSSPNWSDQVMFNGHRVYGYLRWPLVTANWKQVRHVVSEKSYDNIAAGLWFQKVSPNQ